MKRLSAAAAAASAAFMSTSSPSCAAFQLPAPAGQHSRVFSSHDVTPGQSSPPGRALSLSLHMNPPSASSATASTMASYDEQLKRAYSAASYDAMRAGAAQRGGTRSSQGGPGGGTATVSQRELKTTTDALNAALDELKTIREMMGSPAPGRAGAGSAQTTPQTQMQMQAGQGILEQQQQQQQQQAQQPPQQVQTQIPGQLQIERPSQAAGQMVPRRPTILTNSATGSSTTLGTPYKQNQNIQPLRPPTSGTNIDIDRMVNPAVDARYLPTPSQARRIAKTEGNRMEATEAFGRGSAGYYGRRYGVWDSAYGYGPWSGAYGSRYGTPYENSWQSYAGSYYPGPGYSGGYGYYPPGCAYGPYSYGYGHSDPFVYDYGWGTYYGDGRRNAYLWGSQRNGPDYYADTVEFAEGQREMDKERGRQEYARRRDWQERRMRGENMLPPGQEQQQQQQQMQMQMQGQQQQQQQGQAAPTTNGAGATNSYLHSMGAQSNLPQQPQQAAQVPQDAQATAQATTATKAPEKKFSYLESAERDAANSALATSQQANGNANANANTDANGNVGTPDAPYAEAEQMPFRRGYDRYGTSYSDSRYNNPAYAPVNGYWDPYFGYSNWGRYGYNFPYYGGYGGVRGGDWFSDQIRRSERERVYDAQARSRWTGYYGYYGGYGRNSWGDYTFTPASYI